MPRVTILLIGMDSGVGRRTALTDTMMVVSLDPLGRTVSMLSIPRDIVDVPLPDGRTYRPKLNGLVSDVRHHPSRFPGSDGNGQAVLAAAVGELLGLPVDYWAQVNLGSFIRLVDSLGGVDVNVARAFCDPTYDEYGLRGFAIPAGRWHLSGTQALAYARVRKAAGESDFTRAARQQEVVVGLRDRIVRGGFLQDPVEFLRSLGKTVQTNVPPRLVSDYVALVKEVDRGRVYRRVISHPLVGPGRRGDPRGSIQVPDIEAIRALAADLFPPAGEAPSGVKPATAGGSGRGKALSASSSCRPPRPTPKPTPRPTPKPTAKPTAAPTGAPTPQPTAAPTAAPTATPEPTQAPTPTPAPS